MDPKHSASLQTHSQVDPGTDGMATGRFFFFFLLTSYLQFATDWWLSKTSGATVKLFHKFNRQKRIWAFQSDDFAAALVTACRKEQHLGIVSVLDVNI